MSSTDDFADTNGNAGLRPGDPADRVRKGEDPEDVVDVDSAGDPSEVAAELADRVAHGGEPAGDKASSATTKDDDSRDSMATDGSGDSGDSDDSDGSHGSMKES